MMFGHAAMPLDESCYSCDEEEVIWWSEDETEDTLEVYTQCEACGYGDKRFVNKADDTTDAALKEIARKIA